MDCNSEKNRKYDKDDTTSSSVITSNSNNMICTLSIKRRSETRTATTKEVTTSIATCTHDSGIVESSKDNCSNIEKDQQKENSNDYGFTQESNNYYEEDGESEEEEDEEEDELDIDGDDDVSEGSFPTNKDLASFAVDRPPESVSYLGLASIQRVFGNRGGEAEGDTLSTNVCETKLISSNCAVAPISRIGSAEMSGNASVSVSQRSLSFSSDHERPVSGGVMIVPAYAASEAAKSDIATVCSNSVVEDIDVASVGTAHSGPNSNNVVGTVNAATSNSSTIHHTNDVNAERLMGRKKQDRGVEFSAEASTIWKYRQGGSCFNPLCSTKTSASSMQSSISSPNGNNMAVLNDMGPPLNRSLLERVGGGSVPSSTGTPSRAGSVKSFGSQAASDVVHVDTDDCGGSLAVDSDGQFSGLDENPSFQSIDNACMAGKTVGNDGSMSVANDSNIVHYAPYQNYDANDANDAIDTLNNVVSLDKLSESHPNGRVSPGGTVYKGRGVRKYQGRYMHLPLKRFQQNGAVLPDPMIYDQDQVRNQYEDNNNHHREIRRSWKRERSRSRERIDVNESENRWNGSKSPQPSRQVNNNRNNYNGRDRNFRGNSRGGNFRPGNGGRWKHARKNENSNQRYKQHSGHINGARRGQRNGGDFHIGSHKMTPRDPRHRELK